MIIKISRKIRVAISLLIIFSAIFAGYFVLRNYQRQAEASVSSKARFIGFPKMLFPPIDQSVVGWWKLNDAAGQTVVKDWTANANTGTSANNIISATGYTGVANTAMSFNGTSDYVINSTANLYSSDSSGTISFWVKPSVMNTYNNVVVSADEATTGSYVLDMAYNVNGKPYIYQTGGAGGNAYITTTSGAITVGSWYHLAYISNGSVYLIYINGIPQDLTVSNGANNGDWFADIANRDNITIGVAKWNAVINYVNGSISDVRIYNRALSAGEAKQLYMRGRP